MAITRFQFEDRFHGWTLKEVSFSALNLLVGTSGVGKTRILRALQSVRGAGISDTRRANGCEWLLELESEGMKFLWTAETSLVVQNPLSLLHNLDEDDEDQDAARPRFLRERIVRDGETVLVERSEEEFIFNGNRLPKLKNTESAITLLHDEESIAPINRALRRVIFSDAAEATSAFVPYDVSYLSNIRQRYQDLDKLREATDLPIVIKAYILQEDYPDEFRQIRGEYLEIFDTVNDVKVGKLSELNPSAAHDVPPFAMDWLVIGVQEDGVSGWVTNPRFSSGMARTLFHLIELTMAPPGTVIVVDEFENSLGVNCLPQLTNHILKRSRELQFILTSHHPYVIDNVPRSRWKIVTRHGSTVTVLDEESIPALKTASAHEKFILLMNLKEYEEGIQ